MLHRKQIWAALFGIALHFHFATTVFAGRMVAFDDKYNCLMNRQRFIGLRAFHTNEIVVTDPDSFAWAVITQPTDAGGTPRGMLIGTVPNVAYVPPNNWTGTVSFTFRATSGKDTDEGLITVTVGEEYVAPYGIRAPDFGIAESHFMYADPAFTFNYGNGPEPYRATVKGPYTHYVDLDTGSDASNPFGTPEQPRKTIPVSNLPPGSVVEVHGSPNADAAGPYMVVSVSGGGSADLPVFIRGSSASSKPVLMRGMSIQSNYVIVENIIFNCKDADAVSPITKKWFLVKEKKTGPCAWLTFHHVCVRHCLFANFPDGVTGGVVAIRFRIGEDCNDCEVPGVCDCPSPNSATRVIKDCVVYDVEVRNFGNWRSPGQNDIGGLEAAANSKDIWFLDSHVHHLHGNGILTSRNNACTKQVPARDVHIGGNHVHHTKENCIADKHGINVIVSQNKIYRTRDSDSSNGLAVRVGNDDAVPAWPYSENYWVIFNEIYDVNYGVGADPVIQPTPLGVRARVYVVGNVFHHVWPHDISPPPQGDPRDFGFVIRQGARVEGHYVNNTIYKCYKTLRLDCLNSGDQNDVQDTICDFTNNVILSTIDTESNDYHLSVCRAASLDRLTLDYNLHNLNVSFLLPSESGAWYLSVAALRLGTPFGHLSLEVPPLLYNPSKLQFYPLVMSPCRNAGTYSPVYDLFTTAFDSRYPGIQHDINGNPIGAPNWPLGALSK